MKHLNSTKVAFSDIQQGNSQSYTMFLFYQSKAFEKLVRFSDFRERLIGMVSAVQCSEEGGPNTNVDSTDSPSNSSETVDKNKDQSDGLSFKFDALSYVPCCSKDHSSLQQRSFILLPF